jgi:hypothetical protein
VTSIDWRNPIYSGELPIFGLNCRPKNLLAIQVRLDKGVSAVLLRGKITRGNWGSSSPFHVRPIKSTVALKIDKREHKNWAFRIGVWNFPEGWFIYQLWHIWRELDHRLSDLPPGQASNLLEIKQRRSFSENICTKDSKHFIPPPTIKFTRRTQRAFRKWIILLTPPLVQTRISPASHPDMSHFGQRQTCVDLLTSASYPTHSCGDQSLLSPYYTPFGSASLTEALKLALL